MNTPKALFLVAWLGLGCACCSHDAPKGAPAQEAPPIRPPSALPGGAPDDPAQEPAAPPAPLCEAGALRCEGARGVARCDGAAWAPAPSCADAELCLGGACAPLPTGADTATLRPLAPGGHIQRWALAQKPPAKATQSAPPLEGLKWRPLCAPGPDVTAIEGQKGARKPAAQAVMVARLVSAADQQLWVKASAIGALQLWVDGQEVLSRVHESFDEPLPDEWVAPLSLSRGEHTLVARLRQEEAWAGRVRVRLHDARHRAPEGVAIWWPEAPGDCAQADQVDVNVSRTTIEGGFELALSPSPGHLAPRRGESLAWEATLEQPGGRRHALKAGALSWRGDQLVAEPEARFGVKLPAPGEYTLEVKLGEATWRRALRYSGALHDRAARLIGALRGWSPAPSLPRGSVESYTWQVEELAALLEADDPDEPWLRLLLEEAEDAWAALSRGEDWYQWREGLVRRAYRSEVDGRLQPYVVHVPEGYGPDGDALPAVMVFHGLNNSPPEALRALIGQARAGGMTRQEASRRMPRVPETGALLVSPWGYGNNGQRVLGEWDVLRVVEEIKAAYRVDPRRVSLTGYSLGGTVAFTVPLRHPGLFSAAAPLCGYPNLMDYKEVKKPRKRPWEERLLRLRYLANVAENGLHLPLYVFHGGKDFPERSRVITDRYEALGYRLEFDLQEEMGHNVWDYAYEDAQLVRRLMRAQAPALPKQIHLKVGEYRYNKAWWVTVEAMEDSGRLAEVKAAWKEGARQLQVQAENVAVLSLETGALVGDGEGVLQIGGQALPIPPGARTWLWRQEGRWAASAQAPPLPPLRKRAGLDGPLDAAQRKPAVVIYGASDPAQAETNRLVAEHHAALNPRTALRMPILSDLEADEAAVAGKTLILIGGPQSNRWVRRLEGQLPVRFEEGALILGGRRYEGEGVGVSLIYPSPLDGEQLVVLHAGVDFQGTLASRHLPELAPDYLVYDARVTAQLGETLLDQREVLAGGFFDERWALPAGKSSP